MKLSMYPLLVIYLLPRRRHIECHRFHTLRHNFVWDERFQLNKIGEKPIKSMEKCKQITCIWRVIKLRLWDVSNKRRFVRVFITFEPLSFRSTNHLYHPNHVFFPLSKFMRIRSWSIGHCILPFLLLLLLLPAHLRNFSFLLARATFCVCVCLKFVLVINFDHLPIETKNHPKTVDRIDNRDKYNKIEWGKNKWIFWSVVFCL